MALLSPPWCRSAEGPHVHRVLVVEDDLALQRLLADFLEMEGYAVATAAHGAEALAQARAERPCLALVDLMMPVVDGPTCIAACRADAGLRELPIVVMTAGLRAPAVERLPVQAFLGKPFDLHRLLATIVTILGENSPSGVEPSVLRVVFFRNPSA